MTNWEKVNVNQVKIMVENDLFRKTYHQKAGLIEYKMVLRNIFQEVLA